MTDDLELDPRYRAGLASLWQECRSSHLDTIDEVIDHLRTGSPGADAAANAAHRLAGTLAMFGLPDAAREAREIEHQLDHGDHGESSALSQLAYGIRVAIAAHAITSN